MKGINVFVDLVVVVAVLAVVAVVVFLEGSAELGTPRGVFLEGSAELGTPRGVFLVIIHQISIKNPSKIH